MTAQPKLRLVGLSKTYGAETAPAVDAIELTVEAGQTLALLGPSGCGKSTTLNMIVGLETPSAGDIQIDGRSVLGIPPGQRNVGLVFQDYAVFTAMTVRQNLAFGLKVRGRPRAEIDRAVGEVAELLGMADRLDARVRDMGGSELQRVAIGRTLVTRPALLLLDEPLSNLEASARLAMRRELRRLQKETGLTIIYVTHDQVEALSLADHIAVMSHGHIRQIAPASVIMDAPDHIFVAGFLGSPPMNLLAGQIGSDGFRRGGLHLPLPAGNAIATGRVTLGLRPEAIELTTPAGAALTGCVDFVEPRGPEAVVTVICGGETLKVLVPNQNRPTEGTDVGLAIDAARIVLFAGDTGRRMATVNEVAA